MTVRAILLGPQRHIPTVHEAVGDLVGQHSDTAVALVTAGWEEREAEDGEFREHMRRPVVNLEIWSRVERIFERDPELLDAMRQRHDTLRRLQELYRLRLGGLLDAAGELLRRQGPIELLGPARSGAVRMLQELDAEHASRVEEVHAEFHDRVRPAEREAVQTQRRIVHELLEGAGVLCLAGGHVGVLLHRLELFDLLTEWGERPLVAWSAGAMVLTDYVVLFHQEYGHGADVQVMERGFGVLPSIVVFPHAHKRLDLHDPHSMQLIAERFAPRLCVPLSDESRLDFDGSKWCPAGGTKCISLAGTLAEVGS